MPFTDAERQFIKEALARFIAHEDSSGPVRYRLLEVLDKVSGVDKVLYWDVKK